MAIMDKEYERNMAKKTDRRGNFVRLAESRTQAALSDIRKIGNLSNQRSYEWNDADVRKIVKALKDAVSEMERRFDPQGNSDKQFKL